MIIQDAIDALPPVGGTVNIPPGDFSAQPKLVMRDNVRMVGSGHGTIIPPVLDHSERRYGMALEHLIVDGGHYAPGYLIDWRRVSSSRLVSVIARNGTHGLLMFGNAYYNHVEQLFVDTSVIAVDLGQLANSNLFLGGRWTAPTCLRNHENNFNTFVATAFEGATVTRYANLSGDTNTRAFNVRQEITGTTATPWNQ